MTLEEIDALDAPANTKFSIRMLEATRTLVLEAFENHGTIESFEAGIDAEIEKQIAHVQHMREIGAMSW